MRIGSGGSQDVNQLQSDAAQFRNRDFVVNNDAAFFKAVGKGAVAAENSHVQLYNPAGSGIIALVDAILVVATATQTIYLTTYATQLTGDEGHWFPAKLGGVNGLTEQRAQGNAGILGVISTQINMLQDTTFLFEFPFPILLAEATGLVAAAATVNTTLSATFFGREV